jgi:hypothetical protein
VIPAQEWERCGPWIQAALDHAGGVYTLSDVEFLVRTGEAKFWPGREAAIVTRVERFPRATWLTLWLAGGDLAELRDELRPACEAWGQTQGCTKSIIMGRLGWSKALSGAGYAALAMVVGKDLNP